ncbi:hypothetical protein KSP39_PZI015407 [Platanthera zijinensis]|uniref:Uncharacterized protein n=1 Tax=Platanthera zijinensis TaxID=2320716 RepID=A0AAP0B9D6_9ASPA
MDSCAKAAVFLMALQAISLLLHQPRHVAADMLSPLLSPVFNGLCNVVDCGKGICRVSMNHTFGFVCDCNPGWNKFHGDGHFSFLPCVVPNCSISSSCSKYSAALAPSPFPAPPDNFSLFDACTWSFCGGGDCFRTSTFEHRCGCKQGYTNLLNISNFPCYKDCSIGADCVSLGISISSSPPAQSSSTNPEDNGNSSEGGEGNLNIFVFCRIEFFV